jgi:pantoate--beta-alanine ligase
MIVATTIEATRDAIAKARASGRTIGFVPTMGFLHDGHLSLIDAARANGADFIVVSIFVNPTQFGPNEDFERYPRDEASDAALLEEKTTDLLFLPSVAVMYPTGSQTSVHTGAVAQPLEGERRPGHFDGVATAVLKLFNIVQPDFAVFGRKDAQQCAVIERMVRDLDVPVKLVFAETAREPDGLARSSRNSYLSADERAIAPVLHRALRIGEEAIRRGIHDTGAIESLMRAALAEKAGLEIDYIAVVDPETFLPPADFGRDVLIVGAVKIGRTRLIDNVRPKR